MSNCAMLPAPKRARHGGGCGDAAAAQLAYEAWVHNAEASGDARSRSLALNRLATAVAQDRLTIPRALALLEQAAAAAQLAHSDAALAETEWNHGC
jgi:hypothetical protein